MSRTATVVLTLFETPASTRLHRPASQVEQMEQQSSNHELDLPAKIEALLFVADEPVGFQQLAQALGVSESELVSALDELDGHYRERGLRLQWKDRLVQFVTAPEAAEYVRRFLGLDLQAKLSAAGLEALALIAYRQPITRAELEAVRGVNCDGVLRTLVSRGLVAALGRLDQAGRPILYGTTFEFLQHFGLSTLDELPALDGQGATATGGEQGVPGRTENGTTANEKV